MVAADWVELPPPDVPGVRICVNWPSGLAAPPIPPEGTAAAIPCSSPGLVPNGTTVIVPAIVTVPVARIMVPLGTEIVVFMVRLWNSRFPGGGRHSSRQSSMR
jgi:hypothetical protein